MGLRALASLPDLDLWCGVHSVHRFPILSPPPSATDTLWSTSVPRRPHIPVPMGHWHLRPSRTNTASRIRPHPGGSGFVLHDPSPATPPVYHGICPIYAQYMQYIPGGPATEDPGDRPLTPGMGHGASPHPLGGARGCIHPHICPYQIGDVKRGCRRDGLLDPGMPFVVSGMDPGMSSPTIYHKSRGCTRGCQVRPPIDPRDTGRPLPVTPARRARGRTRTAQGSTVLCLGGVRNKARPPSDYSSGGRCPVTAAKGLYSTARAGAVTYLLPGKPSVSLATMQNQLRPQPGHHLHLGA